MCVWIVSWSVFALACVNNNNNNNKTIWEACFPRCSTSFGARRRCEYLSCTKIRGVYGTRRGWTMRPSLPSVFSVSFFVYTWLRCSFLPFFCFVLLEDWMVRGRPPSFTSCNVAKLSPRFQVRLGEFFSSFPPPSSEDLSQAIGFNVESLTYKNVTLNVWDLGGQTTIR